jgi:hypothetical protein
MRDTKPFFASHYVSEGWNRATPKGEVNEGPALGTGSYYFKERGARQ